MENIFSKEFRKLVSDSREVAIDLGYDYISTVHFFIADCESKSQSSIYNFAFRSMSEFEKFKNDYTLNTEDVLRHVGLSLPLTKEAESTFRFAEEQRMGKNHALTYPHHFFLGALKNSDSLLFHCFKNTDNAYETLSKYYSELNIFETQVTSDLKLHQRDDTSNKGKRKKGYLFRLFRGGK